MRHRFYDATGVVVPIKCSESCTINWSGRFVAAHLATGISFRDWLLGDVLPRFQRDGTEVAVLGNPLGVMTGRGMFIGAWSQLAEFDPIINLDAIEPHAIREAVREFAATMPLKLYLGQTLPRLTAATDRLNYRNIGTQLLMAQIAMWRASNVEICIDAHAPKIGTREDNNTVAEAANAAGLVRWMVEPIPHRAEWQKSKPRPSVLVLDGDRHHYTEAYFVQPGETPYYVVVNTGTRDEIEARCAELSKEKGVTPVGLVRD